MCWWLDFRLRLLPRVHGVEEAHGVEQPDGLVGGLAASGGPLLLVGHGRHLLGVWQEVNLVHPASEKI